MAIPVQGCVFEWGTSTLQEMQELELLPSQQLAEGVRSRSGGFGSYYYVGGEMTLTGLSVAGLEQNKIGQWKIMKITVPVSTSQRQVLWRGWAQYLSSSIRLTTNGVVSFAFQFRLWGASSTIGTLESIP